MNNEVEWRIRDVCVIGFDHFRMGRLNFDIDEASLLKTYGLSTLAPTYVSFAILQFVTTEHWDIGNGKISTMSWTSRLERP